MDLSVETQLERDHRLNVPRRGLRRIGRDVGGELREEGLLPDPRFLERIRIEDQFEGSLWAKAAEFLAGDLFGDLVTDQIASKKFSKFKPTQTFEMTFDPNALQAAQVGPSTFLCEFSPYVAPDAAQSGKVWNIDPMLQFKLGFNAAVHQRIPMSLRVVGPERVTVPAGSFETTRVEATRVGNGNIGGTREVRMTFWYAGGVKRTVKMSLELLDWAERTANDQKEVYELVSYPSH